VRAVAAGRVRIRVVGEHRAGGVVDDRQPGGVLDRDEAELAAPRQPVVAGRGVARDVDRPHREAVCVE
jgi:hypothetical protein